MKKVFSREKLIRWMNIAAFIAFTGSAVGFFADLLFFSESPPAPNIVLGTLAAYGSIKYLCILIKERR